MNIMKLSELKTTNWWLVVSCAWRAKEKKNCEYYLFGLLPPVEVTSAADWPAVS